MPRQEYCFRTLIGPGPFALEPVDPAEAEGFAVIELGEEASLRNQREPDYEFVRFLVADCYVGW